MCICGLHSLYPSPWCSHRFRKQVFRKQNGPVVSFRASCSSYMLLLCLQYLWHLVKDRWMAKKKKVKRIMLQWLHLTTSFFVSHAGLQRGSFRDPSSTLWLQIFIEESSVSEAMLLVCVSLYFWLLLHTPSVSLAQSVRLWVCDRGLSFWLAGFAIKHLEPLAASLQFWKVWLRFVLSCSLSTYKVPVIGFIYRSELG